MHFVITRADIPVRSDDERAIGDFFSDRQSKRADMDMQFFLARQITQSRQHAVFVLGGERGHQSVARAIDRIRHFRRLDIISTRLCSRTNGFDRKIGILHGVNAAAHLNHRRNK